MNFFTGLVALLVERHAGYPRAIERVISHPVVWIGAFISQFEQAQNRPDVSEGERRAAGIVMLVILVSICAFAGLVTIVVLHNLPFGWVLEGLIASAFVSYRQLGTMVEDVQQALSGDLGAGRDAVSHLVGRDVSDLDESGVAGAAIETLAENCSDGVIAPLFFLVLFGLPGIVVYKAINTADSMVGHKNARYASFGWASARLDDLVNWAPARITALLFALAALSRAGMNGAASFRTAFRDGGKHRSVNAGWPEAAMAGALGISLGGPRTYGGETVDPVFMGDGRRDISAADIGRALALYRGANVLLLFLVALSAFLLLAISI